jgi:type I restriction-modification system DNA methylase subunit
MTVAPPEIARLQAIRDFSELMAYLRDVLDWPIQEDMTEDEAFFEYDAAEVGLDEASAVKIERIRRLRPLVSGQPWGIFFIEFRPGKLPITVLRRILRALVVKKRAGNDKQRWLMGDLLFISILGEAGHRGVNLAHFSDDGSGDGRAALRVVDWDEDDAHFHMLRTADELHCLRWPDKGTRQETWREIWSKAFRLKPGQVAKTSAQLATQMAALAKLIRARVNAAMEIESANGPLRRMYEAFKQVLVSDLTSDAFADMYAQTITYGLFAARRSRPTGVTIETPRDMVPNTNPFLRDLLAEFTDVGGATKSLDFDELGIDALVEVLNQADMDAVVADFDDKNPNEDPVIHFYEDFLRQYDKRMKIQRGIFFTPRPVVSFIVRSVDELLRTEFGLKDGLADTTTWGEMVKRNPGLALPHGATPKTPFVQILDPAVGTGTFLVEVIDVIHRTMMKKWQGEGHLPMLDIPALWNEYVATHLLPRLYGFELMMAPYAIAHMKIGLKLSATGYRFADEERLRIFITNTLEEPRDIGAQFEGMAPALAHEAAAANEVKRNTPITVVIGNPPYSGISANMNPWIDGLLKGKLPDGTKTNSYYEIDGRPLGEKKVWLQDDYVKFVRYSHWQIDRSSAGILSFITNHGYIDNPTFRGMRQSLINTFDSIRTIDLHGNANKKERSPDGSEDENVFDIRQGVAIFLGSRSPAKVEDDGSVEHEDIWGTRNAKYEWLLAHSVEDMEFGVLTPSSPYYFLGSQEMGSDASYESAFPINEVFVLSNSGIVTARDGLVLDLDIGHLRARIAEFCDPRFSDSEIKARLDLSENYMWRVKQARKEVMSIKDRDRLYTTILYRPFNLRHIFFCPAVVWRPRLNVMSQLQRPNVALVTTRQTRDPFGVLATRLIAGHKSVAAYDINSVFPLYVYPVDGGTGTLGEGHREPNIAFKFLGALSARLRLPQQPREHGLPKGLTAEDIFDYAYAVFHSPTYRSRYAESLKIEFPRLPLTASLDMFRALTSLGDELVALHLMESPKLDQHRASYLGPANPEVEKPSHDADTVWLDKKQKRGFRGVPEDVWRFHVGGYQVCEKWLKDRRGRVLSEEDIEYYQKIVVAISETIRIMGEIDEVIEEHGGWPGAFATGEAAGAADETTA